MTYDSRKRARAWYALVGAVLLWLPPIAGAVNIQDWPIDLWYNEEAPLGLEPVDGLRVDQAAAILDLASPFSFRVQEGPPFRVSFPGPQMTMRQALETIQAQTGYGWRQRRDQIALRYHEGYEPLFDGKTLAGWEIMGSDHRGWSVVDGALACKGGNGPWLRCTETLSNFSLRLQYRIGKGGNSGIFVRSAREGIPWQTGWEVQVMDTHADGINHPSVHSAGAVYDVLTPMLNAPRPAMAWNEVEIACRGTEVTVQLNGYTVIDYDFATLTVPIGKFSTPYAEMPLEGFIGFQDHGDPVWYRNIRVKRLR